MMICVPRFSFLLIPFIIVYSVAVLPYGFAKGTLVKTPHGYAAIETIRAGDSVVSYNDEYHQSTMGKVTRVVVCLSNRAVRVYSKDVSLVADCNQQFCVPIAHEWITPRDSCFLQQVSACYADMDQITLQRPVILYDLVIEPYHTFYVTTHDIIVHNVMEHALAFVPAITISATSTPLLALSVIMPVLVPMLIGSALMCMVGKHVMSHMRGAEHENIDACEEDTVQLQPPQGYDPEDPEKAKEGRCIEGDLNFTRTTSDRMRDPARMVPMYILKSVLKAPLHVLKDPQGASEALMYYARMWKNGKLYNIEVLYHGARREIMHFVYSRDQLGPLSRIR